MLYLFGLSVAFFLFVLIVMKKEKKRADYILLTWIGVVVVHLALFNLHLSKVTYQYPVLLGFSLPIPVLHGAFIYFYTLELVRDKSVLSLRNALLHLIPFLLLIILAIPFYRLPGDAKIEVFENDGRGFEWYSTIQGFVFLVVGVTYSFLSIREIRRYRRRAENQFSNLDKKMLRWLEYLAIGLGIIWLLSFFSGDQITFAAVVLFVLFIGFFGINQYPVFSSFSDHYVNHPKQKNEEFNLTPEDEDVSGKYAKSGLTDAQASALMARLDATMKTQAPFRNPNLTLDELAGLIGVSSNHLSQVINASTGNTFYQYINTYRINEFLKLAALPENRKFTFLGLAGQCGYTSKTTFNKYFRLQTGKSPSEYFGSGQETSAGAFAEK